jgi:hypothetical protein
MHMDLWTDGLQLKKKNLEAPGLVSKQCDSEKMALRTFEIIHCSTHCNTPKD